MEHRPCLSTLLRPPPTMNMIEHEPAFIWGSHSLRLGLPLLQHPRRPVHPILPSDHFWRNSVCIRHIRMNVVYEEGTDDVE
jgi:hypothetical protein